MKPIIHACHYVPQDGHLVECCIYDTIGDVKIVSMQGPELDVFSHPIHSVLILKAGDSLKEMMATDHDHFAILFQDVEHIRNIWPPNSIAPSGSRWSLRHSHGFTIIVKLFNLWGQQGIPAVSVFHMLQRIRGVCNSVKSSTDQLGNGAVQIKTFDTGHKICNYSLANLAWIWMTWTHEVTWLSQTNNPIIYVFQKCTGSHRCCEIVRTLCSWA